MNSSDGSSHQTRLKPKKLTPEQIEQINLVLASLDEYGEVHLIIQHGELKYINKVESHKAWNDEQGKKT
jgi:hypothetical protein